MLLVANHVTEWDGPLLAYGLPGPIRHRLAVAMAGEMLEDRPAAVHLHLDFVTTQGPHGTRPVVDELGRGHGEQPLPAFLMRG